MLLIFALWIYLLLLFWTAGVSTLFFIKKLVKDPLETVHFSLVFLLGFSSLTLLSILLSLFFPLGKEVSLFYALLFIVLAVLLRKEIKIQLAGYKEYLSHIHPAVYCLFFINLLIFLSKSASPSEVFDEGGYHMPFIKWIENFSVVPGLGNIEFRYGFNSSFHILLAPFTFSWLFSDPFFDLSGLVGICLSVFLLDGLNKLILNKSTLTKEDFILYGVKALLIPFLFRNFITGTSSDFVNIYVAWIINLILLEKFIKKDFSANIHTYLLICFSFLLTTVKFSSVLMLFFVTFYLIIVLIKNFNKKVIFAYFSIGALFIFPWLLRSYIMTGYILYPLHFIDLFSPDWKVSYSLANDAYIFVESCAKNEFLPPAKVLKLSFSDWFPSWFHRRFFIEKVFLFLIGIISITNLIFFKDHSKKTWVLQVFLFLLIVFWLFKFPDFRFGYGFILIYIFIGLVNYMLFVPSEKIRLMLLLLIIGGMTLINIKKTYAETSFSEVFVKPASPRQSIIFKTVKHGKYTFNYSKYCWYTAYPCFTEYDPDTELRGNTLQEGFRKKTK
jgi:hypothetical protein